jgi:ureidoglycolate hydrolase
MPCFLDRKIVDRLSKTMQDTDRSRTCFISGLAKTEDENTIIEISDLLYTLFEPYKPVDVQILPGKGQAYVMLESPSEAKEAIAALHGFVIEEEGGATYQLNVSHSRAGL